MTDPVTHAPAPPVDDHHDEWMRELSKRIASEDRMILKRLSEL